MYLGNSNKDKYDLYVSAVSSDMDGYFGISCLLQEKEHNRITRRKKLIFARSHDDALLEASFLGLKFIPDEMYDRIIAEDPYLEITGMEKAPWDLPKTALWNRFRKYAEMLYISYRYIPPEHHAVKMEMCRKSAESTVKTKNAFATVNMIDMNDVKNFAKEHFKTADCAEDIIFFEQSEKTPFDYQAMRKCKKDAWARMDFKKLLASINESYEISQALAMYSLGDSQTLEALRWYARGLSAEDAVRKATLGYLPKALNEQKKQEGGRKKNAGNAKKKTKKKNSAAKKHKQRRV